MRQAVVPPHPFTAKPPHRPRPPLCPTIIATPSSVASRIPRGCHLTLDALLSSGVAASAATFEKNPRCCPRGDDALYTCTCRAQPRVEPGASRNQTPLQTPLTLAVCRALWSLVLGFRLRKEEGVETRRIVASRIDIFILSCIRYNILLRTIYETGCCWLDEKSCHPIVERYTNLFCTLFVIPEYINKKFRIWKRIWTRNDSA